MEVVQKIVPRFRMREKVWLSEDENNGNFAKDDIWQMTKLYKRSPHSIITNPVSYNVILDCSLTNLSWPEGLHSIYWGAPRTFFLLGVAPLNLNPCSYEEVLDVGISAYIEVHVEFSFYISLTIKY
jgi:hypothetical protein